MNEKLNNKYFIRKTTLGLLTLSSCLLLNQIVNNSIVVHADEINYVSDKAKEVKKELEETLIIKNDDKEKHTFKDKVKFDDSIVPNEYEKKYLEAIEEEFNKYPEVVRENVNSITIVRKPNALYGYTYSLTGDVNMNMQYYHPELKNDEPGSIKQTLEVLGHEVGHIFNGKSFKDNYTWSYSRDSEYAKLSKEVYNNDDNGFRIGRWATDFGNYLAYIRGEYKPDEQQQKIMNYMASLFNGILTPSKSRLTEDLKKSLEFAKSKNKQLIYDGHLYLDSNGKNINELKKVVLRLRKEINDEIRNSKDNIIHYKTIGIKGINNNEYIYDDKGNPLSENLKPEYWGGVNDNEPLIEDLKEFNSGVSDNNPIINYEFEYNGLIDDKTKPLINEKPEFKGSVNDDNPLINEISDLKLNDSIENLINNKPEYTGTLSTNTPIDDNDKLILPPVVNGLPEYTEHLEFISNESEIHKVSEFNNEVNSENAHINEKHEYKPENYTILNNSKVNNNDGFQTNKKASDKLTESKTREIKKERELPKTNSTSILSSLLSSIIILLSFKYKSKLK